MISDFRKTMNPGHRHVASPSTSQDDRNRSLLWITFFLIGRKIYIFPKWSRYLLAHSAGKTESEHPPHKLDDHVTLDFGPVPSCPRCSSAYPPRLVEAWVYRRIRFIVSCRYPAFAQVCYFAIVAVSSAAYVSWQCVWHAKCWHGPPRELFPLHLSPFQNILLVLLNFEHWVFC